MPLSQIGNHIKNYAFIGITLALSWTLSSKFSGAINTIIANSPESADTLLILSSVVFVFALGFVICELAKPTVIPSFVLAIFFGIASRDILAHLTSNEIVLSSIITIGAVLVLFGGGLDIPFQKFRSLIGPILSLAFFGTLFTAFSLSLLLTSITSWMGISLPLPAIILLGAALASTDPAAIIPSFQSLLFTKPRVKHIAISESAINDVAGAVLVTVLLALFSLEKIPTSVFDAYTRIFAWENVLLTSYILIIGIGVGIVSYGILLGWSKWKERVQTDEGSDSALFLTVPLFSYTLSALLGGSGFLAAFASSLLFRTKAHCKHVEHYFNHTIEGFMKPVMFMLLGALVDPVVLMEYAQVGVVAGLLFMFVLRPLVVLVALTPFCFGKNALQIRELAFLSFVRETGVIPAALLITIYVSGIPGAEGLMAIGLWVILMTLVIEPPLTPWVAKKLGLAEERLQIQERTHVGPVAVLCSRGYSFPERLKTVVDWALQHQVDNIALLHCPEEKYSPEFVDDVHNRASKLFKSTNKKLSNEGKREINFEFLCGPGLLQDNIESLIAKGDVSIIFVGSKMLDYRLDDVKHLNVPFYFMA